MELYFCGFNGYSHCPGREEKVLHSFTRLIVGDFNEVQCDYRTLTLKNDHSTTIYQDGKKCLNPSQCYICSDDFIIISNGLSIEKINLLNDECYKMNLVPSKDDFTIWGQEGNFICKMVLSVRLGLVIMLSNGSVWRVEEERIVCVYNAATSKAKDIAAGFEHALILTDDGCLLVFGNGRGQLGCGDLNSTEAPVQVPTFDGMVVSAIAAGGWHSCVVTDSADAYVWGWNCNGQLGQPTKELGVSVLPVPQDLDFSVKAVACGSRHTMLLSDAQAVYGAGWNLYSQLGFDSGAADVETFTEVPLWDLQVADRAIKLQCGPWSTMLIVEDKKI